MIFTLSDFTKKIFKNVKKQIQNTVKSVLSKYKIK